MRRLRRLRRLVVLQERLQAIEERRLLALRQREAEIADAEAAILEALGRDGGAPGRFGQVLSDKAGRLAADGVVVAERRVRQNAVVLEQTAGLRQAERRERALTAETERQDEAAALDALAERLALRGRTSFR